MFRRTRAFAVAATLGLVTIASFALADSKSEPKGDAAKETPKSLLGGGKPTQKDLDKLLASTDDIAKTVSKLRGLPIKKEIVRSIMSKEAVTQRLLVRVGEDYADGELENEARAMKRLGLMPPDFDYKKKVIDLLTEQIAGFYDPQVRELYIADWIDPSVQRITMAHEIDHALQDQSFDLNKFIKPVKDDGDAQLARQALVEGDGTALMIEFMMGDMGIKTDPWANDAVVESMGSQLSSVGMPEFDKAPMFMKEELMFPYLGGVKFIAATRKHSPWSKVDDMFRLPPESTEQIMHPEKYAAQEHPLKVTAVALPSLKGYTSIYSNVLGELGTKIFFQQHGVAKDRAEKGAAGWGGDRLVVYAPPGDDVKADKIDQLIVVSLSAWDEEADAIEAWGAGTDAIAHLAGSEANTNDKTPLLRTYAGPGEGVVSVVERKDKKVLMIVGVPAAKADKVRAETWAKWTVKTAAPVKATPAPKDPSAPTPKSKK